MNNDFTTPIRRALATGCQSDILGKFRANLRRPQNIGGTRPAFKRLFQLGQAFHTGNCIVNATHLSKQFGVSIKTIQRDIKFLREELDMPIRYNETQFNYSLS